MNSDILYSYESLLIFLLSGVVLGLAFSLLRFLKWYFSAKKITYILVDFTFAVISFMVIFIIALCVSSGRLRLIQILCQSTAFVCVLYVFNFNFKKIRKKWKKLTNSLD